MNPEEMTFEELCEVFGYTPKNRPLSTAEVAEFRDVSKSTVEHERLRGVGPRYFSPEGTRRVWYSERDLLAWMYSGLQRSTSDEPGGAVDPQRVKTRAKAA